MANLNIKPLKVGGAIGAAIAAMAVLATPIYESFEGKRNTPYKDIAGVWTVCSGETRVEMRKYTDAECKEITRKILEEDFGPGVAKLNPSIVNYPVSFVGHTTFAANIGLNAYAKSSVLKLDLQGKHREACRAMRLYDKAGGKRVQGLVNRREGTQAMIGEYELCLADAVERDLGLI